VVLQLQFAGNQHDTIIAPVMTSSKLEGAVSPHEFVACNSLWGGTATGNVFIDFFLRPIFKLGFQNPLALTGAVICFYSTVGYWVIKSTYFSNHDNGNGYYNR
jgi:hypothetical protein